MQQELCIARTEFLASAERKSLQEERGFDTYRLRSALREPGGEMARGISQAMSMPPPLAYRRATTAFRIAHSGQRGVQTLRAVAQNRKEESRGGQRTAKSYIPKVYFLCFVLAARTAHVSEVCVHKL